MPSTARSAVYFDVSNAAAEAFWSRSPDRYMRLRYEDFVARPVEMLREVGDSVGEEFDTSHLFADGCVSVRPTHSAWGNPNRFEGGVIPVVSDTAWVSSMQAWRRAVVTGMTSPFMLRYGYRLRARRPLRLRSALPARREPQPDSTPTGAGGRNGVGRGSPVRDS